MSSKNWRKKMIYFKEDIPYLYAHRKISIGLLWVEMDRELVFVKKESIENIKKHTKN